jgi:hypothetical protein
MTLRQLAGPILALLFFGMALLLAACSVAVTASTATPATSAVAAGAGTSTSASLAVTANAGASAAGAFSVGTATAPSPNGSSTSGQLRRETRQVSGFHAVTFSGVGTLLIDQTGTESLTIEAEPKVLALLGSDVVNGRLLLGPRAGASFQTQQPIIFRLTVKALDDVTDDGSGRIDGSHLQAAKLGVVVRGSGAVNLNGSATVQDISVTGSGSFDGASLAGKSAQLRVTGSGQATVNASDALNVVLTGSGSVRYLGNPTITQQVSGSGSIGRAAAP